MHLFFGLKGGHIELVAHGAGQYIRDTAAHSHMILIFVKNLFPAQHIVEFVPETHISAELMLPFRHGGTVKGDHICPDLVNVGAVGEIDHVRGETARRTHIDFQSYHVPFLAEAFLIFQKTEEFEMDEAALYVKALDGGTACCSGVFGKLFQDTVGGVASFIDHIHESSVGNVTRLKQGLSVGINDGIIRTDLSVDELLHNVENGLVFDVKEMFHLIVAGDLNSVGSAHAVIRFGNDRIQRVYLFHW